MMTRTGEHSGVDTALAGLLAQGYERACTERRPVLVSLVRPVRDLDPLDFFTRGADVSFERVYWEQPSEGFSLAGIGAAHVISPADPDRFSTASSAWRELLDGAVVDDASMGTPGTGPLLLGGFSFDPDRPASGAWDGFPDAMLALPRFLVTRTDSTCWTTTSVVIWPDSDPDDEADRLTADLALLSNPVEAGTGACPASPAETSYPLADTVPDGGQPQGVTPTRVVEVRSPQDWQTTVAEAARRVRDGALEKVVLAREVQVQADADFDVPAALGRLRATYPSCYVFAVARGGRVFLGATPERLVRLRGDEVRATCLAGSIRRGGSQEEDRQLGQQLLHSEKDRIEHEVVVRTLRDGLDGLCDEIDAPEKPALLSVSNVHHLYTPVTARLKPGATLLDLVGRLHPTPAVGGSPRREAMVFIREHEDLDRGWYAAPVGWLGWDGAGEFAVALRSALVDGSRASLFAGCGIVADSDPEQEYAESRLKLRPMLDALGGRS